MNTNKLPTLPSLTTSRTHATSECACGCGGFTQRMFTPGHDSRLKGLIIRLTRGVMTIEAIEEWADEFGRGAQTVDAVTKGMSNAQLMKNWNLTKDVAAFKAAEAAAAVEEIEATGTDN
jgi:hypothetical protein